MITGRSLHISEIQMAPDGGLEYIRQHPAGQSYGLGAKTNLTGLQSPKIPVDRLVAYVNDQEGGNWYGISMLRALFRHWVRKDRLLRVDAINAERNGAGVPMAYAPPNATTDQIKELGALARSYRAGESSGGALPNGADIRFKGVEGTLPDVLASLRYDDEQMAARFCAQFSKLGTTQTGSFALGQTLADFFALAQEAVAKQYADVTNEHVSRTWLMSTTGSTRPFRTRGEAHHPLFLFRRHHEAEGLHSTDRRGSAVRHRGRRV
jgi:hypothetical protein